MQNIKIWQQQELVSTEHPEFSLITDRSGKCYGHLENSLTVSHKFKHLFTIWPSNPIPRYLH
jgi:hypothetical protein